MPLAALFIGVAAVAMCAPGVFARVLSGTAGVANRTKRRPGRRGGAMVRAMNKWLRTALVGFIAGAASVLIFHQLGFWIVNQLGYARVPLYSMRGVPPWGVPFILSAA